jgi:hypothetical protein
MDTNNESGRDTAKGQNIWLEVAAGIVCIAMAIVVARHYQVPTTLPLDLKGDRAQGTAERQENGQYRLRYEHPSGSIHTRSYSGPFGLQGSSEATFPITVAYDFNKPSSFQPARIAYFPGLLTAGLFATGMVLVLRARGRSRRP